MKKLILFLISFLLLLYPVFSQEYVGKIIRSKDTVYVNGKFYDKTKSTKNVAIGDEIKVCCGGTVVIHFEKDANIVEKEKTMRVVRFVITKPNKDDKNSEKNYSAYTSFSAASRGGIFDPPLNPPNGAFAFLNTPVTFQWNKPGDMFYLKNNEEKVIFKFKLNQSKKYLFKPDAVKLKAGKYFWSIDKSEKIEINFIE